MAKKKKQADFQWLADYLVWWRGDSEQLSLQNYTGSQWFATAREACNFAHEELLLLANASLHPALPRTIVNCHVYDGWDVIGGKYKPITANTVYRRFKKAPSGCLLLTGAACIHDDWQESVHMRIYGKKEVQAYLESPEMKELAKIMGTIGAEGATSAGVFVEADNG